MIDESELPRLLRLLIAFLKYVPMTELKTLTGLVLVAFTALWLTLAACFQVKVDTGILDSWFLFLSGLLAITSFGQGWKQSVAAKAGTPQPPSGA